MDLDADIKSWIGRSWERQDVIDQRLIAEFKTTLSPHLASHTRVPLGIFWCLAPDLVTADQLGGDGHPQLGLFLPNLTLPRRMWAGGAVELFKDFDPDSAVTKRSSIDDIAMKNGKSGRLCFLTVRHEYLQAGDMVLREKQDIVYREASALAVADKKDAMSFDPPGGAWTIATTPTMLFRYSAMTFNGHRIHYDHPYATEVEGYAGLVVHGPLQATLLLNHAADRLGRMPKNYSYRGLAPLVCGTPLHVMAESEGSGLTLKAVSAGGTQTMSAAAS